MKEIKNKTEYIDPKNLFLLDSNPRTIKDENFKKLKESIKKLPNYFEARPILVNKTGDKLIVYAGNMRLKASLELKMEKVPCIIEELTDEEQKERMIRDNIELGEWNIEKLQSEFEVEELGEWGLDINFGEVGNVEDKQGKIDDDEIPKEDKTEKRCKLGDLWQLGSHKLLCGDSTKKEDVEKLMNGEKADLGFNDPPYGMKKEKDGVINDNLNYNDLLEFNKKWIDLQFECLKDNGSFYCWGTDEPLMDIYSIILKPLIKQQKATFRNLITWDKGNGQGQNSENTRSYAIADEKCLFVMCGVQGFNDNADNYFEGWEPIRDYLLNSRLEMGWDIPTMKKIAGHSDLRRDHWTSKSQFNFPTREVYEKFKKAADEQRKKTKNDAFKKEYDELKKEYDELKKEYYSTRATFNNTHDNFNNVWHFKRTSEEEKKGLDHSTQKPIDLCMRAIKSSSEDNDIVLDVFGGSGSTLIACEKTNRKCYMMELDEHYCDVILQRWEAFTGEKAVKLS